MVTMTRSTGKPWVDFTTSLNRKGAAVDATSMTIVPLTVRVNIRRSSGR